MRSPSQVKRNFIEKWAKGLQIFSSSTKEMNVMERKKAIKLSADIAMASARNGASIWSLALIENVVHVNNTTKFLVQQLTGNTNNHQRQITKKARELLFVKSKRIRIKKILKNRQRIKKIGKNIVSARSIAKKMVEKRTLVLKMLVPGGRSMDEFSLIRETLDYISSLRVQVEVMRHIADASDVMNNHETNVADRI